MVSLISSLVCYGVLLVCHGHALSTLLCTFVCTPVDASAMYPKPLSASSVCHISAIIGEFDGFCLFEGMSSISAVFGTVSNAVHVPAYG